MRPEKDLYIGRHETEVVTALTPGLELTGISLR